MRPARALILVALVTGTVAACGGGGGTDGAAAACDDTAPGPGATFATADVAFAAREGEEAQSARADGGGYLPWFAKFGLFVRGRGDVVVRVPATQHDDVNIVGWGVGGDAPPRTDIRVPASRCWTGYPGGLIFTGHTCVRLQVEGPGKLRGFARFGLRRACGPETLSRREQLMVARARVVFAAIVLDALDHESCLEAAGARRCAATGEPAASQLLTVFRANPDGIFEVRDEPDLPVREIVAQAADDLHEYRPEVAAKLDAAL
jgi:hypothetical protein